MEIVKHDRNMVVQTSPRVEVKTQCTAADHGNRWNISQPGREKVLQELAKAGVGKGCNIVQAATWKPVSGEFLSLPSFIRFYVTDEHLVLCLA